jgi:hypothetical protein
MQWFVDNGVLKLGWSSADDIIDFLNKVVIPNANALGVEIIIKKKEVKKAEVVRR